jgi:creatinine amidohydrolase
VRESDFGGMSHACELETSLYLAIHPELVQMEKAVDERSPLPASFQTDLNLGKRADGSLATLMPYWSTMSVSGVRGDATRATREKGEQLLEGAIEGLIELIGELKSTALRARRDHH